MAGTAIFIGRHYGFITGMLYRVKAALGGLGGVRFKVIAGALGGVKIDGTN